MNEMASGIASQLVLLFHLNYTTLSNVYYYSDTIIVICHHHTFIVINSTVNYFINETTALD